MRHEIFVQYFLKMKQWFAILQTPCALVIKLRLTAATIAITPKPDPPDVTVSGVALFLSLASPLTG